MSSYYDDDEQLGPTGQVFDPNQQFPMPAPTPLPGSQVPVKKKRSIEDILVDTAPLGAEEDIIKQQHEYAKELRATPMQDLRHAGRVVVAMNPLEGLNTAIRRGQGEGMRKQSQQDQRDLAEKLRKIILGEGEPL